ncbi:hypothetical protein [Paraferrimonas sedimenticola]|uniref:Uncharacterized protein n=1 Tax=Paraferrimonas sedimenticola TaxID=375674 RepID=A0AA37W188_9GAMM|nr:hypothetical protein [Paraferrimonas sedimenticola]GLP96643.1 hypothetical protein GCM10007895_19490 [Paraferrimonas sedimenticola]
MEWIVFKLGICIWIVFFGGAERIENTFTGYLNFGQFADKARLIKALAIVYMIVFVISTLNS